MEPVRTPLYVGFPLRGAGRKATLCFPLVAWGGLLWWGLREMWMECINEWMMGWMITPMTVETEYLFYRSSAKEPRVDSKGVDPFWGSELIPWSLHTRIIWSRSIRQIFYQVKFGVLSQGHNPSVLLTSPGTSEKATLWEGNRLLEIWVRGPDPISCHHLSCG